MNFRNLLNFEITKTSPRWKAREFEGAELVRVKLAEERWARWIFVSFRLVIIAMFIPVSIETLAITLGLFSLFPSTQAVWQSLTALAILLSFLGFICFGPHLTATIIEKLTRPSLRTKLIEPPPFRGWLIYGVGWFFTGLVIFTFAVTVIAERSIIQALRWTSVELYLFGTGWAGVLVARGLFLHLGDTVCCRRCSYPVPSNTIESPGSCTECGRDLARKRGMMIGQRIFRPVSFYAGLGIVIAATVLRFI